MGSPTLPSTARLWAAAPSAKPLLPDWPGLGPRCQHGLRSLSASASMQAPTIIYSISVPRHHVLPSQTAMRRRQPGDESERGFNYSIFQWPQNYSGAKRTIGLVNKKKQTQRTDVCLHFNGHRRKPDGDPTHGTGSEPSPNWQELTVCRFSNPAQNAGWMPGRGF